MSVFNVEFLPSKQLLAASSAYPPGRAGTDLALTPQSHFLRGFKGRLRCFSPVKYRFITQVRMWICFSHSGFHDEFMSVTVHCTLQNQNFIKLKAQSWLSEHTRTIKRHLRWMEHEWRANESHSSLIYLKHLMMNYDSVKKPTEVSLYLNINSCNPRTLFTVINLVISPPPSLRIEPLPQSVRNFYISVWRRKKYEASNWSFSLLRFTLA